MIRVNPKLVLLFQLALTAFRADGQASNGAWVYPSATGNLLYQLDERGQRINDFSQCGYRGGTEPLPDVTALIPQSRWVTVNPGTGDDTALIQAAIDSTEALTPDANGWRGVVLLKAGEYQLASTLTINASGVVLKGEGDSATTGTRLRATDPRQYNLISVTGSGSRSTVANSTRNLTQKLVPAGARTFEVDSTSGLAVGHTVIVKRPSTANWIADIDMDQLGPAPVVPWTAGSKDLLFDRVITRIEGNRITVDVPLPQTFESVYGGGQIWRYTWTGRIQQVGIEDIYGFSDYASATDENHAWKFIQISNAQHVWVRDITAQYFGYSAVSVGDGAKWLTVADSQCLDPISLIDGGRRYSFNNDGAECTLFVNNYARKGRHDFVFGATVPGPNAFVHCMADTVYSDTGPHHRWSVGGLFDLVNVNGNQINVRNRGNSGTGHGWAGAYMAVWNCKASSFSVRNPPTARNWLVGSIGTIASSSGFSVGADPAGTYDSSGPAGTGEAVHPRSLYYGQLQQRMKWPGSEFREVWVGDVDQHSSTGGTGETVNCNPTWLAEVEALGAPPADSMFDLLAGNRHTACTLDFSVDPGETVVAASLTVSLRGIGSAASDSIWLDTTASPRTYASLGWTPVSTTAPTVRTLEVSPALLADGRLNLAFGTNTAVDFAVLHLQVQKAQSATQTIVLNPVADAHVMGGANAGTNYGTNPALVTKEDTSPDFDRETFLRWDLSGLSGRVVDAKVRLAGITVGQAGNESCATFVENDAWGETAVNFTNKPAAGKLFAQWLPVAGQPVEFTVTPQVVDTMRGDDLLSLSVLSTGAYGAGGIVNYASRENPTLEDRPQLILTIETAVPTISDVADQTVSEGTGTAALPVIIGGDLPQTLGGTSSNTTLVPNANIVFGGSGANRTVTVTPAAHQSGTTTITLTTSNGTQSATDTFTLTVAGVSAAVIKAATGSALNLASAWSANFVPVNPDTATWNASSLAGAMTLGTNLSWAGLIVNDPADALTFNGTQTLTLGSGGIDMSASTVNLTLNHPVVLGENQTWNLGANRTLAANGLVSGPGSLTKAGVGTLTLSGLSTSAASNHAGNTVLGEGTLAISAGDPAFTGGLTFGTSNASAALGTLDLGTSSASYAGTAIVRTNNVNANTVTIGNGRTLTLGGGLTLGYDAAGGSGATDSKLVVTGGGGLAVNGATIQVSVNQAAQNAGYSSRGTLDVSALAAFGTNVTQFNIGVGSTTTGVGNVLLSNTANSVLATTLTVGNSGGNNGNGTSTLTLGAGTNAIQADSIEIGKGKGSSPGVMKFASQAVGSPGTVTIANKTGTGAANITLANVNGVGTAGGAVGTLDLRGHVATVNAGTLLVSRNNGSSGTAASSTNGTLHFNAGTFTVGTLTMAQKSAAATGTATGTLNVGGGAFTVNTAFTLGSQTGSGAAVATLNLTGGTFTSNADITQGGGTTTSTISLDGAPASTTLDLTGKAIGTLGNPITFNVKQGTLQNVASINGTGGLTKTTAGTLVVAGTNSYSGATLVSDGTLALGGSLAGALTVNAGTFAPRGLPAVAGALTLNAGGTFQARINGSTVGTQYDQLAAGSDVSLGGPLDLVAGPGLSAGAGFVILNKTSAGAIGGTFSGKPEGSVFTDDGYLWVISYHGGDGNDVVVALATAAQSWRFTHFGTVANSGNAADTFDANGDGEVNLLEFASGQNPHAVSRVLLSALRTVGNLEVTYTRSKEAVEDGVTFEVEWSDTLAPDSWSDAGVTESTLTDNGTLQSVKATIPTSAAIPRRFVRLNVTSP
jgi:autotransporter-associated beta strand protein